LRAFRRSRFGQIDDAVDGGFAIHEHVARLDRRQSNHRHTILPSASTFLACEKRNQDYDTAATLLRSSMRRPNFTTMRACF
jgi:hypothetical protein